MSQLSALTESITEGVDMPQPYRGSKIRNFRSPPELEEKIQQFLHRSGWDAASLIRTAVHEFLARRPPGDRVAPPKGKKKSR